MPVQLLIFRAAGVLAIIATTAMIIAAAQPTDAEKRTAVLIERLDDDSFEIRNDAVQLLLRMAADPATHAEVRKLAEARLADKQTTLDVREALQSVVKIEPPRPEAAPVPAVPQQTHNDNPFAPDIKRSTRPIPPKSASNEPAPSPTPPPAESELTALLETLGSPAFDVRHRAERQLVAAAESPALCGAVLSRLLELSESPEVTADAARRWAAVWQTAWGTWLLGSDQSWRPPLPDERRLAATIERLVAPESAESRPAWVRDHAVASRLLLLWLAEEGADGPTAAALRKRIDSTETPTDAVGRLGAVHIWTHPAMAAEFWTDARHQAVQHLLIGVPNQPPGAPRPSLFIRCDEKVARCESGNSLAPGDHPVGIFFPHPSELQPDAMFHLVNLPTPRRRLAYEYTFPISMKSDVELNAISDRRRGTITKRTVEYLLERKQILTPRQIDMFQYLDPAEASRFIEPYLLNIDDERYDSGSPTPFGNGSLHGWFAYMMTNVGTPESGRALATAIDKGRILPPTASKPYRIEWAALLDLARREPWPDVDRWLADHLDRTEPMNVNEADSADLGASCAALLLERNGAEPSAFDLEHCEFDELIDLGQPGYRFTKTDGRETVKRWWADRKKGS